VKRTYAIAIIAVNLILITLVIYLLNELKTERNQDSEKIITTTFADTNKPLLIEEKQDTTAFPEYVPPKNGGNNKNWNGYKHKNLLKDRPCYFGKGLRKMHRWGQKMNRSNGNGRGNNAE